MAGTLTNQMAALHVDADASAEELANSEEDIAHSAQGHGPLLNAHIEINQCHSLVFCQSSDGPSSLEPMPCQPDVLQ